MRGVITINKMSNSILMLVSVVFMMLSGCSSTEKLEDTVTKRVVASDFVLEVTTPTVIGTGETMKVKGTLEYTGIKPVEVTHGKPIIRFSFPVVRRNAAMRMWGTILSLRQVK